MTEFESKLHNMVTELDAQQQTYEQEEWAKISNTTLADYRKEQEAICNEGIDALQKQRDAAIASKKEQLSAELKEKARIKFSAARCKLEEALALFASSN